MRRFLFLIAPIPTIAASIALATWARHDPHGTATRNVIDRQASPPTVPLEDLPTASTDLQQDCEETAGRWRARLGPHCTLLVRAPFVLAGDMPLEDLERAYLRTIQPAAAAMGNDYFDKEPHAPISLLLFTHETTYTQYAEKLFGQKDISIYGYYKPASRTLILNLGTGGGTLVHELTHALIDFDFPAVPVWFNEGLASLHEQCRFDKDDNNHLHIEGLSNWRLSILQEAFAANSVQSLQSLATTPHFLGDNEAMNYAHARYLCMFLQQRGVLTRFYKAFRDNVTQDPRGDATLLSLFPGKTWQDLDREFRQWVLQLQR